MKKCLIGFLICILLISSVILPVSGKVNDFQIALQNPQNSASEENSKLQGDTLYVGGDGPGNYSSIQDAIDDANNGYTILVFSGTYNEHITLDKQLFLRGIRKDGEELPVINGGDDYDTVVISSDGCTFEKFKVRNGPSGYLQIGITLLSDNNIVKNCTSFNTGTGLLMTSSFATALRPMVVKK